MGTRHELQTELTALAGTNVFWLWDPFDFNTGQLGWAYFQPPESLKLSYPCYVYHREMPDVIRADNKFYRRVNKYGVTYITPDPDDPLIEKTEEHFQMCQMLRSYAADGLNHYYYELYY